MTPDSPPSVSAVIEQLAARCADALATLDLFEGYGVRVDAAEGQLENPDAVREYLSFFTALVKDTVAQCERIVVDLPHGIAPGHSEALRQLASRAAAEQRRCLLFRDRWINKPLSHEALRPLLNDLSITTRDQLTAFLDLNRAADQLEALVQTPASSRGGATRRFDRRALFTRLFRP